MKFIVPGNVGHGKYPDLARVLNMKVVRRNFFQTKDFVKVREEAGDCKILGVSPKKLPKNRLPKKSTSACLDRMGKDVPAHHGGRDRRPGVDRDL